VKREAAALSVRAQRCQSDYFSATPHMCVGRCVCMYVNMYVCMYELCIYVCMYVGRYECMYINRYISIDCMCNSLHGVVETLA
jgi:hypothetical protein